jgi:alpha-L-rhamnosidase
MAVDAAGSRPAAFVWTDADNTRYHDRGLFRYCVDCAGAAAEGRLNLFCEGNYNLFVNGEFVAYGPCRSKPEYPRYDTHDLTSLLRPGRNLIALQVVSPGALTFHHMGGPAGFIAWGQVTDKAGNACDLATPGGWQALAPAGYERYAARFSFTSPNIQMIDMRSWPQGWATGTDTDTWTAPVIVDDRPWGELRARTIPLLSYTVRPAKRILGCYPHSDQEDLWGCRVPAPPPDDSIRAITSRAYAAAWVQSPREQTVRMGHWWGEFYLNGRRVPVDAAETGVGFRQESVLPLNAGWNFLFVHYGMSLHAWDLLIGLPKSAGLRLYASQDSEDAGAFLTAGPYDWDDESIRFLTPDSLAQGAPTAPPDLPWKLQRNNPFGTSPAQAMAWQRFGSVRSADVADAIDIPAGEACSLVYDMGQNVLGRIRVDYEAPAGTVLDIGFGEEMSGDRPHLAKNFLVNSGEREIAAGGRGRFSSFHPRGHRFVQVSVRNHDAAVAILGVAAVEQIYPHAPLGQFRCSDATITKLWQMGVRTLELCSEDVYTDCPWRERTLYTYDMLPEIATTCIYSGDMRLARRCLELMMQDGFASGRPIIREPKAIALDVGTFMALLMLVWYTDLSADASLAEEAWSQVKARCDRAVTNRLPNGLVDHEDENGIFIDHKRTDRRCSNTALNSLIAEALAQCARLASDRGCDESAEAWLKRSDELRAALRRHAWVEEGGRFADSVGPDGPRAAAIPVSSYWPSCYGCTDAEQEERLLQYYTAVDADCDDVETEPFGSAYAVFYLLGACYRHGHVAFAEHILRRYYGHIAAVDGDTIWEHFNPDKSRCHAWSSAPSYYASTRILGVRMGFPEVQSMDEILIAPESESITWAEGTVPHPRGQVSVRWEIKGQELHLRCRTPEGVSVRIEPQGRLAGLKLVRV